MARRKSRTRSRRPASIGSNQLSKRCTAVSVSDCGRQVVVLFLVMAWSPPTYQRRNRLLDQAGDYAALIFQPLPLRHLDLANPLLVPDYRRSIAAHCQGQAPTLLALSE